VIDVLDPVLELDQAAVDAEFAAIVLAEAPWGASQAAPAPTRRRPAAVTRLAPVPRRPRERPDGAGRRCARGDGAGVDRRRPGSVARSPPSSG
jgi:hypothetical protein